MEQKEGSDYINEKDLEEKTINHEKRMEDSKWGDPNGEARKTGSKIILGIGDGLFYVPKWLNLMMKRRRQSTISAGRTMARKYSRSCSSSRP